MRSEGKDSSDQYWQIESCNLQKAFDRKIRDLIESGEAHHFSIFAFAFTDRVHATVYQLHRETRTWQGQPHPNGFAFNTTEPEDKSGIPGSRLLLEVELQDQDKKGVASIQKTKEASILPND